jgi:hypothetical protein
MAGAIVGSNRIGASQIKYAGGATRADGCIVLSPDQWPNISPFMSY